MNDIKRPEIIHCDWSVQPAKRWAVRALWQNDAYYLLPPEPVTADLLTPRPNQVRFVGVDVPLGLPLAYARQVSCDSFIELLPQLGQGEWGDFFRPAETVLEIDLKRPFYPQRPGGTKQKHLLDRLNLADMDQLRRLCDRATADRRAAAALFWTMGAQQVGKAAITFWRDWLQPAWRDDGQNQLGLWPFQGSLFDLLATRSVVVAEAYPSEFYHHLGVDFPRVAGRPSGKRVRVDRQRNGDVLFDWVATRAITLSDRLMLLMRDGFGDTAVGEDQFDATVGAMGMINVVLGDRAAGEPCDHVLRLIEGHILGQSF